MALSCPPKLTAIPLSPIFLHCGVCCDLGSNTLNGHALEDAQVSQLFFSVSPTAYPANGFLSWQGQGISLSIADGLSPAFLWDLILPLSGVGADRLAGQ